MADRPDRPPSFDHDEAVRLRVPAVHSARWAELLAEASIEALAARPGLAGRLAMIIAQSAAVALEDGDGAAGADRLELGVAVDSGLDQFTVSATQVPGAGKRAQDRVPATDRLELLADEVELRPGPEGKSVRARLSLDSPWAEPTREEPALDIAFEGSLFVRALLPRALTVLARSSGASLRWASELLLLGHEVADAVVAGPQLETLRFDASARDEELALRAWPLADELLPTLTDLLGRDHLDADVEVGSSEAGPRHSRLLTVLPIERESGALDA
jgi:hypothetical protein